MGTPRSTTNYGGRHGLLRMTAAVTAVSAIALGVLPVWAADKGEQEVRGLIPKIVQA